jgi:hypothetical protein
MFKIFLNIKTINRLKYSSYSFQTSSFQQKLKRLIETKFNENNFEIKLNDESNKKNYPYIWLRDCCPCQHCFDNQNYQHLVDLANIPENIKPIKVTYTKQDSEVEVICKLYCLKLLINNFIFKLKGQMDINLYTIQTE